MRPAGTGLPSKVMVPETSNLFEPPVPQPCHKNVHQAMTRHRLGIARDICFFFRALRPQADEADFRIPTIQFPHHPYWQG